MNPRRDRAGFRISRRSSQPGYALRYLAKPVMLRLFSALSILVCRVAFADELTFQFGEFSFDSPPVVKDLNDSLPLVPTTRPVTNANGKRGFIVKLKIRKGIQIYSERALENGGIPLKLQFLNRDFDPIPADISYPEASAKRVKVDSLPDYFVYVSGSGFIARGYPARPPKYLVVSFHGFNNERMH